MIAELSLAVAFDLVLTATVVWKLLRVVRPTVYEQTPSRRPLKGHFWLWEQEWRKSQQAER